MDINPNAMRMISKGEIASYAVQNANYRQQDVPNLKAILREIADEI